MEFPPEVKAPFIISKPTKRIPKPIKISPKFLTFSFLKKDIITPISAVNGKNKEIPWTLDKETSNPVTVVPI